MDIVCASKFSVFILGTNDNDIYDHPEWQYLNEYTTQNDQFGDLPQKPVKTKVNKNATSKSGVSTPASKQGRLFCNNHWH